MATYSENSLRKKLKRRGYSLHKWRDAYGTHGYVIADSYNALIYGGEAYLLDLVDVAEWIEWLDKNS